MVGILQELAWHEPQQFLLHLQGGLAGGDAGAVTDAEDVGVHRDRGLSEGGIEHHVGGLASDAGEYLQGFAVCGDLSLVLRDEDGAGLDEIPGLAVEQPDGSDVALQAILAQGEDGLRRIGQGEQLGSGLVHPFVGGLGGEDDRHQQLERCGVGELRGGLRIGGLQALEDDASLFPVHGLRRSYGTGSAWFEL